jgi:hypothetical protein
MSSRSVVTERRICELQAAISVVTLTGVAGSAINILVGAK